MFRLTLAAFLVVLSSAGCVAPPSASQRLVESAYDLNAAARFGRMDVALEHVREAARDAFSRAHAPWGKSLRVVDYEISGVAIGKDGDADVTVTVSWQRFDESTLRSTDLAQHWVDKRGTWWMLSENERSGDKGLLSAADTRTSASGSEELPARSPVRSRYQTRVIYEQ